MGLDEIGFVQNFKQTCDKMNFIIIYLKCVVVGTDL